MNERRLGSEIWPTQALRAWLEALTGEIRRTREELENRISLAEKEAARLRRLHERAGQVIESLRDSIGKVDIRLQELGGIEPATPSEPENSSPKNPAASETDYRKKKDTTHKEEKRPAGGRGPRG